jgi:hypothetical protein
MKWKQFPLIVAVSAISAVGSVWIYGKYNNNKSVFTQTEGKLPANYAGYLDGTKANTGDPVDFTKAANASVPAVVHIKTKIPAKKVSNS